MYAATDGLSGYQSPNGWMTPDTNQRHPLGMRVPFVDPFWGYAVMIYGKASGAIPMGTVCIFDELYNATGVPNTANQGFPVVVAMNKMATLTFGWFIHSGLTVYATNATIAADVAVGITAAGILGAATAGKQINGVRNRLSATATVVKTNVPTINGSSILYLSQGYDGWFLGMALSGTGIPAAAVVAKLGSDGNTVSMGSAIGTVDKTATATASVSVTGTYTGFGAGVIEAPTAQGQIV